MQFSVQPFMYVIARGAIRASLLTCLFALSLSESRAQAQSRTYSARVSFVYDGDTLWVRPLDGGRTRKLRIEGIDAPEICQEGGLPSRDALRERLKGQAVVVREHSQDTYGRPLVDLTLETEDVAAWMVREGWAWSYRWHDDPGPYAKQEAQARKHNRGIFALHRAEEPRDFRRRNGPCVKR